MDHVIQYATEREGAEPWVVRDRQAALSNERKGQGKALFRTWVPSDWTYVNEEEEE